MTRRSLTGARAIVTGASGGIGRELALQLARQGACVLVTARRQEPLDEVTSEIQSLGGQALAVAGDITSEETRRQLCETARAQWGQLDILVNNAGVGALGRFESASQERLRQLMEVNFFAPVELIRLALPLLRDGNRPLIANVSSVLGHRAVPGKSEYCASKFAVHGFSDALRAELASIGVDVLLVSPSTTDTDFFDHVLEVPAGGEPARRSSSRGLTPFDVARSTIQAMERGRHEVILPVSGRLLVWLDRLAPSLADWLVAKYG